MTDVRKPSYHDLATKLCAISNYEAAGDAASADRLRKEVTEGIRQ